MYRVLGYVSTSASFEIAEKNNSSKCLGGRDDKAHTFRGGGTLETYESVQGGGGSKIDKN